MIKAFLMSSNTRFEDFDPRYPAQSAKALPMRRGIPAGILSNR